MLTKKGIIDGLRKGESKCLKPRAGDADFHEYKFGKNCMVWQRGILVEVEVCEGAPHEERTETYVAV